MQFPPRAFDKPTSPVFYASFQERGIGPAYQWNVRKLPLLLNLICFAFLAFAGNRSVFAWAPGTGSPAAVQDFVVDTSVRNDVLSFFNCIYTASENYPAEIAWSGTVSASVGVAGTTSAIFKEDVRRRINFYRALVSLPADITFDATACSKDQEAALMFVRNADITHNPPPTWLSYTAAASEAAANSNLAIGFNTNTYGPEAINGYMRDDGNGNEPVGHRRWLIFSQAQIMGTGDIPLSGTFACANANWVVGNFKPTPVQKFVPWPSAGYLPLPLVPTRWSLTYPGADFSQATVSMTKSGTAIAVQLTSVNANGYGDNTLVWTPTGVPPASINGDTAYHVTVSGIQGAGVPSSYSYTVTVFDPDVLNDSVTISGTGTPDITGANYTFNSIPGVDALNLQVSTGSTAGWTEGAEDAPVPQIQPATTGTYALRQSAVKQTGAKAFQLTFPEFSDQSFQITRSIIATGSSNLVFNECFHFVTAISRLSAEVSTDNGITWTEVWGRNGSGSWNGISVFNSHSISLAGYAGTPVVVRFIFRPGNSAYIGQDTAVGIFLDDISVTNATELVNITSTNLSGSATSFTLNAVTAGTSLTPDTSYYLRIRPSIGLRWYGFGPIKIVKTNASAPVTGSLQVSILPAGAVSSGAEWQVDGGAWQNSNATVSGLSAGSHTVAFNSVNGWISPGNQIVTINDSLTTLTTGTYTADPFNSSVKVTILPAGAVSAGAQWQVDGGTWQNSNATVSGLSAGSHTVSFNSVNGWTSPGNQIITLNTNQTTIATGTYTAAPFTGSLQVTILPAEAASAGAKWQVDGGAWQSGGVTVSGLTAGSHTIAYSPVNGWIAPVNQTVTVNAGQTTITTGSFTAAAGNGSYHHDFTGALPLWDISGSYSGNLAPGVTIDFSINEDASGKFTGIGIVNSDDGAGNVLTGSATISGAVKSSGTATLVSMTIFTTGTGTVADGLPPVIHDATFSGPIKIQAEIDGAAGELHITGGSSSFKLLDSVTGKKLSRSQKFAPGAVLSLPDDVTGDWGLVLNLTPAGTKYTGSATIQTSTGGVAALTVTGSYKSKTGTSKISLKGTGGSLSMVISTPGTDLIVESINGKLFGQTLSFKAP